MSDIPFDGYWEQGGNEILNRQRAFSYAQAASCPNGWLRCGDCPPLPGALGDDPYTDITQAPWYDQEYEPSHRFLGAYPLTIEGVYDSTRTATITEGILDGGVIQGARHAVRQVRATALLIAEGKDALESGISWLKAALDAEACSGHGSACGEVDACFFVDCPPERGTIPTFTDWETTATNLAKNPSFEAPSGTAVTVRQNLVTNPSFESSSGTVEVRRNMATNPLTPGAVNSHVLGIRGALSLSTDYMRLTINDITAVDLAQRIEASTTALAATPVVAGQTYTLSARGRTNSATARMMVQLSFRDNANALVGPIASGAVTPVNASTFTDLAPVTAVAPAGATRAYWGVGLAGLTARVLGDTMDVQNLLLENAPSRGMFFDGSAPAKMRRNLAMNSAPVNLAQWQAAGGLFVDGWVKSSNGVATTVYVFTAPANEAFAVGDVVTLAVEYVVDALGSGGPLPAAINFQPHRVAANVYYTAARQHRPIVLGQVERVVLTWTVTEAIVANDLNLALLTAAANGSNMTAPPGFIIRARRVSIERGQSDGQWFDGSTPLPGYTAGWEGGANNSTAYLTDNDLTTSWSGTANASASIVTGAVPATTAAVIGAGVQSGAWASTGAKSLRVIATTSSNASRVRAPSSFATVIGRTYTVMAKARLAAPLTGTLNAQSRVMEVYASATGTFARSVPVPNVAGVHAARLTFVADAVSHDLRLWNGASLGGGDVWWDDLLIIEGDYTGPYFDGATPLTGDAALTTSWDGVAHASTSSVKGFAPITALSPAYQSAIGAAVGTHSIAVPPNSTGDAYAVVTIPLAVSTTYTVSGVITIPAVGGNGSQARTITVEQGGSLDDSDPAPNQVGTFPVRHTFTTGAAGTPTLRLYGNGDVTSTAYWDALMVVEGASTEGYFDGDFSDDELIRYEWSGIPHESASLRQERSVTTEPEPDILYDDRVDAYRRQLHGVVTISGPIITQTFHREPFWAYLVEFTVAAANPFVFSLPRQIDSTFIPSGLIQDVPFNLVPYPSAELADSTPIVMMTNFSPNPSLEVNATTWVGTTELVSGAAPPTVTNNGRATGGTTLVNAGTASMRSSLVAPSTGTTTGDAYITIYEDVPLNGVPAVPAGARVSLSVWAAVRQNSGVAPGTVVKSITADVQWRDGTPTTLRTDVIGVTTTDFSGVTLAVKSLVPPVGAVTARVRVRALVTWSASATPANKSDFDLYVDTLSLTTP